MSLDKTGCTVSAEHQAFLLALAKGSIRHGLNKGKPIPIEMDELPLELTVKRATFVTLEKKGALRGCIGCLEAVRPLAADIAANAYAAAFRDPRFPPVAEPEIDELEIHLSLLTPAEPIAFSSEADLISQLVPEIDGLILEEGPMRGTFLPSVWETLPEPEAFIRHLKRKAGLPAQYWSTTLKIYRYRSETIGKRRDN
jgi:AmmeMemoRadiSam system protein A